MSDLYFNRETLGAEQGRTGGTLGGICPVPRLFNPSVSYEKFISEAIIFHLDNLRVMILGCRR